MASSVACSSTLPREVDVVVAGAGLAGVATALALRSHGIRVAVCEKGVVAGEQSSRALGWVASLGDTPGRLELSSLSKDIWRSYATELGIDTTFRQSGLTLLCYSDEEMDRFSSWEKSASSIAKTDARPLTRQEIIGCLGVQTMSGLAGAYCQPSDGGIDPRVATSILARAALELGVTIHEQCAVRGVETSAGAVSAVVTEAGTVRTPTIVVASGAWSRLFCGNLGIDLPITSLCATTGRLRVNAPGPRGSGATDSFGWHQHTDGTYTFGTSTGTLSIVPDSFRLLARFLPSFLENRGQIKLDLNQDFFNAWRIPRRWALDTTSPFETSRVLVGTPDAGAERAYAAFRSFFGKSSAELVESWGAVMDSTPDRIPVIGPAKELPGLYLCTGFSSHGLAMGPAAARLVTSQILGHAPPLDAKPYRPERFRHHARGANADDIYGN